MTVFAATGPTVSLSADLHGLNCIRTDQFAIKDFVPHIANLTCLEELFLQGSETDRISIYNPVEGEIAKGDRLCAGYCRGHAVVDMDRLAKDRIIGVIPQVVPVIILTLIDNYTDNKNIWTIVVHRDKEKLKLVNSLVTAGIDRKRIRTIPSGEFFDLDDTAAAHRITELRYRF